MSLSLVKYQKKFTKVAYKRVKKIIAFDSVREIIYGKGKIQKKRNN